MTSMKYSVDTMLTSGGRLGKLTQMKGGGTVAMETPLCTLFTKGGSAPHLSAAMLQKITRLPDVACMNLGQLARHHEAVTDSGKDLKEFTSIKSPIVLTTLHDASAAVRGGKNNKNSIAVWSKGGNLKLDPKLFMKVQESFQPDWFQALSDGDTDKSCSKKRLVKSVNNTLDFLDEILQLKSKSEKLKSSSVIGVIEGGYNVEERVRSAKETCTREVDGFLIEGFEKGHSGTDLFSDDEFIKVLKQTLVNLPENKPRIMEAVWSPLEVVKAFTLGIDVFSSAYPHALTEKGQALVADYSLPPKSDAARLECDGSGEGPVPQGLVVDLNDKRFFERFTPIMSSCECYTCANFTCSYIHHLRNTSELLSYVLLTIHNFEQYFEFFQRLRQVAREDRLSELEMSLSRQCEAGTQKGKS